MTSEDKDKAVEDMDALDRPVIDALAVDYLTEAELIQAAKEDGLIFAILEAATRQNREAQLAHDIRREKARAGYYR